MGVHVRVWTMAMLFHCAVLPATDLSPASRFTLPPAVTGGTGARVREMKAGTSSLWFLVEAEGQRPGTLVQTDLSGQVLSMNVIPPDARPMGLAATAIGAAVLLGMKGGPVLESFSLNGGSGTALKLSCAFGGGLFSLGGNPATVCSDGRIAVYKDGRRQEFPSWARKGAHSLDVGDGQVAFVDWETAKILVQDLNSGAIRSLDVAAPEIQQALERARNNRTSLESSLGPSDARPGNPIVVMDAASRGEEMCLLIWPYHKDTGPSVVCLDRSARVSGRWRCLTPPDQLVHRIALSRNGDLYLCSTRGIVLRYKR